MDMEGLEAVLISKILGNQVLSEERCMAAMGVTWIIVLQLHHLLLINMALDSLISTAIHWIQAMIEVVRQVTEDKIEPLKSRSGHIMVHSTTLEALTTTNWMVENELIAWMEVITISTQISKRAQILGIQLSTGRTISINSMWTGKQEETQGIWSVHPLIK